MSDATILRFPRTPRERGSRSGRFAARSVYRRTEAEASADTNSDTKPNTGPRDRSGRFSTRSIYRKQRAATEADAGRGAGKQPLRLVPEIATDRPGMATDYSCRLAKGQIARIRLSDAGPRRQNVDWVFVPPAYRAAGVGRQLMRRVVADADRFGVTLTLEARACAGLDQAALEAWYGRFGFSRTGARGDFGPVLARPAAAAAPARRAA